MMFSEDFPWNRILIGAMILFLLITYSSIHFPLTNPLRVGRYILTFLLWMTIVFSSLEQTKQDAARRRRDFDSFVAQHRADLERAESPS